MLSASQRLLQRPTEASCAATMFRAAVVALAFLSTEASFLHTKRCGQQTTVSLSTSADAAGTAEFSDVTFKDGGCNMAQNGKVSAIKFCGPGTLTLSRMTCSEHHEYKAMVVEHASSEYTTNCETISTAGTVVEGWLGSLTMEC